MAAWYKMLILYSPFRFFFDALTVYPRKSSLNSLMQMASIQLNDCGVLFREISIT